MSIDRLNGILSVTRALGDSDIGDGLSFVPDVYWFKKSLLDGPILMYSDGIYELERYQKEIPFNTSFLYDYANKNGANELVNYAFQNGSEDNLTVLLLRR